MHFYAGGRLIRSTVTSVDGVAQCSGGSSAAVRVLLNGSYQVDSAGTPNYLGATTSGPA